MNIKDFKNEIRDMGFEDDDAWTDAITNSTFYSSVTRALKMIATTVKAPITSYTLELNDTGRYDLSELTKNENNEVTFDSIDRVVKNTDKGIDTFADWDIVEGKILVVDPQQMKYIYETEEDSITVYYKQRIFQITSNMADSTELPIEYTCEPLLSLLTAHYVWLDDDERKAVMYYNEYDQMKQEILAEVLKPKARIVWRS